MILVLVLFPIKRSESDPLFLPLHFLPSFPSPPAMLKLRYVDEVLSALRKTTSGNLALTVGGKDTPIGNQGLIRLLAGLEGNPFVQSLDLSRNLIGKPGAIHLARYLKSSPVKKLAVTGLLLFFFFFFFSTELLNFSLFVCIASTD